MRSVREALRGMAERESRRMLELERLRQEIDVGMADVRSGRVSDLNMKRLKTEARKELSARRLRRAG